MESRTLKELCIDAIAAACISRGPRRGVLRTKCPPATSRAAAAWLALMYRADPSKVNMGQILFMGDDQLAIYNAICRSMADADLRGRCRGIGWPESSA
jgi:hypothetical protein